MMFDKPENKSECIREAISAGKDTPADIAVYIKEKYNIDVDTKYISVIKSKSNERLGIPRRKISKLSNNQLANYVISSGSTEMAIEKLTALKEDKNLVDFLLFAGDIKTAIALIEQAKKEATA